MGKAKRKRRAQRRERPARPPAEPRPSLGRRLQALPQALLHPQAPAEPCWRLLPWVLLLAFAARAAVALEGSFLLHPDEIYQHLEPAHQLVFGNGVVHWEWFYGARFWLVPGLVAAVLALSELLGLGQPHWYIGAVKLTFCAVSLLVPAGMYFFARRHFDETAARIALLAGAFWYELVGFAHKPMTEFVATAVLLALLALCVRPLARARTVLLLGLVAVLVAATRLHYAPLALFILGVAFFCTPQRLQLTLAAATAFLAVGLVDGITWGGGPFHSYLTNIHINLIIDPMREGESPVYQFLLWLGLASVGLGALCALAALPNLRRYGFLLLLIVLILLLHSLSTHKEYRFIFAVIPLWLLIGSDLAARAASRLPRRPWLAGTAAVFALVSAAGILNALPDQDRVYHGYSNYYGTINFFRERDPLHDAYLHLAQAPGVEGVLHVGRFYHELPGYYLLHRKVPLYDLHTLQLIGETTPQTLARSASHILTEDPDLTIPGYQVERAFGPTRILRREKEDTEVRKWQDYRPNVSASWHSMMLQVHPEHPAPPPNFGVRFAD